MESIAGLFLQALRHQLHTVYLPKANLCQFYQCDVEEYVHKFIEKIRKGKEPSASNSPVQTNELELIQDPEYRRLGTTVDFELALTKYNIYR